MSNSNTNLDNIQHTLKYFSSPYNILTYATICSILNQIDNQELWHLQENDTFAYLNDDTLKRKVASPNIINNIKSISFIQTKNEITKECPITLEPFNSESNIAKLHCGHIFSYDAIYTWLSENSNKCPCCRYEYDWIEK